MRNSAAVEDEDLSREALSFLYGELLPDPDSQKFVQRLSVLVGRQDDTVLEAIRRVEPTVRTSAAVLLDRILTSVVEGDADNGYLVPPVFRNLARQRIPIDEQRRVFSEVARTLLEPEGNVIREERTISGITHALLAGDVTTALGWTTLLVHNALDSLDKAQLEVLLNRLHFVSLIKPQAGLQNQLVHALALVTLSFGFQRIGRSDAAAEALARVKLDAEPAPEDNEFVKEVDVLRSMSVLLRAAFLAGEAPDLALQALQSLSITTIGGMTDVPWEGVLSLLSGLIRKCGYSEKIGELIRAVLARICEGDATERHAAMMVAFSIAMRAKEGDLQEADLEGVFGQFDLSPVLANVCKATYLLETGRVAESLPAIDSAVQTLRKLGYSNEWDLARLELTRGDAAYKLERDELAIQAYRSGVAAAQQDSFEYAWCSWRLGTLSNDENLLSQAAAAFKSLNLNDMCARALGAQGAVLADAGDHARALSCFASVVSGYYESQIDEMGAPAAVALAHITRLRADLTGESLPGEAEFPAFETTAYETVIPTARPQGTHATACFLLGETYRASGENKHAYEYFRKALNSEHRESELYSVPLIVERILTNREAVDNADEHLLGKCAELALDPAIIGSFVGSVIRREFVSFCLFHDVDAELSETGRTDKIAALLRAVDKVLSTRHGEPFWYSEVNLRRAILAEATNQRRETIVKHFRAALAEARKVENGSVMIAAGHALGFEYPEAATSLRELTEFQFAALHGIELQKAALDQTITLGRNLYSIWRQLRYARLSDNDLKANKLLRRSAVAMDHAGTDPEVAGKAMVVLLCKLYKYESSRAKCLTRQIASNMDDIPIEVRECISD